MSKYNFRIDKIDPNTTHGMILSKIKPGSEVLECGCATGYMTKYMTEQMGCVVDVIEYDEEAIQQAEQYCRKSFCGDLNYYQCWDRFKESRYDFIMFADVLEHLTKPMRALMKAAELLKPEGRIIVSIPNICHNDIVLRMVNDLFCYTDMGLLDNTHIHFWGLRNFIQECDQIGLHVAECNCMGRETGKTEQALPSDVVDKDLLKILKEREFGEVYQFVFTIGKKEQ